MAYHSDFALFIILYMVVLLLGYILYRMDKKNGPPNYYE